MEDNNRDKVRKAITDFVLIASAATGCAADMNINILPIIGDTLLQFLWREIW